MNSKFFRNGIVMLVLVVGTVALLYTFLIQTPKGNSLGYSQFLADVEQNKVTTVVQEDQTLSVTYYGNTTRQVVVPTILTHVYQDMQAAARAGNVTLKADTFASQKASDNSSLGLLVTTTRLNVVSGLDHRPVSFPSVHQAVLPSPACRAPWPEKTTSATAVTSNAASTRKPREVKTALL